MSQYLIFSTPNDLVRIAPDKIVCISAEGNYSTLTQANGDKHLLTAQLGQLEASINLQLGAIGKCFIRIGRSLIINRNYISYINISKQKIVLSDALNFTHVLEASRSALKALKDLLEKEVNNGSQPEQTESKEIR